MATPAPPPIHAVCPYLYQVWVVDRGVTAAEWLNVPTTLPTPLATLLTAVTPPQLLLDNACVAVLLHSLPTAAASVASSCFIAQAHPWWLSMAFTSCIDCPIQLVVFILHLSDSTRSRPGGKTGRYQLSEQEWPGRPGSEVCAVCSSSSSLHPTDSMSDHFSSFSIPSTFLSFSQLLTN